MTDNVNHPSHYTDGKIEVIDYIKDKLTDEQFVGFCKGNVMKYVSRAGKKGSEEEDLMKALVYLGWAVDTLKGQELHKSENAKVSPPQWPEIRTAVFF